MKQPPAADAIEAAFNDPNPSHKFFELQAKERTTDRFDPTNLNVAEMHLEAVIDGEVPLDLIALKTILLRYKLLENTLSEVYEFQAEKLGKIL